MTRLASRRPGPDEYTADYHAELIEGVPEEDAFEALCNSLGRMREVSRSISAEHFDRIHPPYGWTVRQVIEHCVDAERVFGYRIMRFAAGDPVELPGWDENLYAASRFGLGGGLSNLIGELTALRQSTSLLLQRVRPKCWDLQGRADGQTVTVRALAFITCGHLDHHTRILRKRLKRDDAKGMS